MSEKPSRFREIDPHYSQHIKSEIIKAEQILPQLIYDPSVIFFGCVDKLTRQSKLAGRSAFAGGGLKMQDVRIADVDGLTTAFIVRAENKIPSFGIGVHLGCGEMLIGEGLMTVEEQIARLVRFFKKLVELNERFKGKTQAELMFETVGTAFEFMHKDTWDWLRIQKLKLGRK